MTGKSGISIFFITILAGAAGFAIAQDSSRVADLSGSTSPLKAARSVIALNVTGNEPESPGETFPPEVKRLYCFSQITGAADTAEIEHRWYWREELMSSIALKIKSKSWRTYSIKTIPPGFTGDWRVAIVDTENDAVLETLKFTIQ